MKRPVRILLLEDCDDDVFLVEWELRQAGLVFESLVVRERDEFERALRTFRPDVVLADHSLPRFSSIEAFEIVRIYSAAYGFSIPFILVAGGISTAFATEFIVAGIDDYISKDSLKNLPAAIESALRKSHKRTELVIGVR